VPHASDNFGLVFLNLLTSAAPKAKLPPMQLAIDERKIHRQARREARNPGRQRLAMRFACCNETEHLYRLYLICEVFSKVSRAFYRTRPSR
jgi:hypothetical protein